MNNIIAKNNSWYNGSLIKIHNSIGLRKVAGSIHDGVIGIFHWLNPSSRAMALGSTQPVTEMSTRTSS
jgi:hypothetical protein